MNGIRVLVAALALICTNSLFACEPGHFGREQALPTDLDAITQGTETAGATTSATPEWTTVISGNAAPGFNFNNDLPNPGFLTQDGSFFYPMGRVIGHVARIVGLGDSTRPFETAGRNYNRTRNGL
jgi:hypothetical protein